MSSDQIIIFPIMTVKISWRHSYAFILSFYHFSSQFRDR